MFGVSRRSAYDRGGVEDLYLDLAKDIDCPYDMISKLDNVKTVYIVWVLSGVERVIKKVAKIISRPHRESRSPGPQRLRMRRWVKEVENSRVAATRDVPFKHYVRKQGWECA